MTTLSTGLRRALRIKNTLQENSAGGTSYVGHPFWNCKVTIDHDPKKKNWLCILDDANTGNDKGPGLWSRYRTLTDALRAVDTYGGRMVTTTNMLNPAAGEIPINLASKGGCCDPATETYHCM